MKGSDIVAEERAEGEVEGTNAKSPPVGRLYGKAASERFPHLNDGSNLGKKPAYPPMPAEKKVDAAFKEVYADEPSTVTRANVHGEQKRKMMAAIAINKARKA